ncbi:hypothetical protein GCM10023094_45340 [Rhodococcus olei]|uniref:Secreted protein n=1 Tax=Rhodococcus olei TaxID=2161675 RepID=A0ABP8PGR8_9NOCA
MLFAFAALGPVGSVVTPTAAGVVPVGAGTAPGASSVIDTTGTARTKEIAATRREGALRDPPWRCVQWRVQTWWPMAGPVSSNGRYIDDCASSGRARRA